MVFLFLFIKLFF